MIKFDPEPERPVWIQVMEIIRGRIQDGTYPPRAKIPSLTRIAQEFEVGLNTARHVVDDLAEQGLVRPVRSMGTFVVPVEDRPSPS
ncbi:winged helix-turn-helix domain-containing protein [Streptosporangium canum]|uniref:winged helix-turn-helix domain-containing protein n=1 Tax=Streptosporangium canum TaxID=324952 RepID=UPI003428C984